MMRRPWRAPLMLAALLSLTWGAWMGLLRIGWALPLPWPDQLILHGPLMIGGFLGTLITLERAIGVAKPWAYAAPLLTAAGSAALVFGPPGPLGPALIVAGSIVVFAVFGVVLRRDPSLFAATMAIGVAAWIAGNARWIAGAGIYRAVFWWVGFIVLTIAGERLELSRLRRLRAPVRLAFIAAIAVLGLGIVLTVGWPESGVRVMGGGLVMLGAWLGAFDVARRTVREPGVTRFIAICLLTGYVWLGVAGVIAIVTGAAAPGPRYDALLHAIFLGFAVAMFFGHAPIVLPAVLGTPMRFRRAFYVPLVILHCSVAVRITGDFVDVLGQWRAWGGLLNAVALAAFAANAARSIAEARG